MNELSAKWVKSKNDLIYAFPSRPDGRLLNNIFTAQRLSPGDLSIQKSFIDELTERGYDLTTLRFSIKKKEEPTRGKM
ncbi:MAG: hypothetical protein IMZ64_00205 [Bacteroidetes bacterium]|nr:hypothetical protein [Bacteroidota bacterium]